MPLDPPTLLLANLLVALTLVLIVTSTRVGLGGAARGMRSWLAGDVLLLAGQSVTTLDALPLGAALHLPPLTLSSGLVTAGIALHLTAIHRHRQAQRKPPFGALAAACAVGLAVGLGSAAIAVPAYRAALLNVALLSMLVLTVVRNLVPVRRFLGVRILMAAMGFAIAVNVLMLVGALMRPDRVLDGAVTGLLANMVMTMVTTSAFVLWLQEELRESLQAAAQTDALTGALNRHGVMPQLRRELARSGRHGPPLSVALCDIDHFKRINDTHGHAAGDVVLRDFAEALRLHARASDLVARWGGEEFLLVLPDTDNATAKAALERIRQRIAEAPASAVSVTFSAGIASTADPGGATRIEDLLLSADQRLYAAKATRDSVVAE